MLKPYHRSGYPWNCLVVVLLAWALRLFLIGNQELRGDEAFSWDYAAHEPDVPALAARIVRDRDPHSPIDYALLQGWIRVWGDSEFALRSQAAFVSLLIVPLTYQLARKASRDPKLPILAAAVTALHPYQIWLGQDVRSMYPLACAASLASTLQLPGLLAGRRQSVAAYVLCGALAVYSHYYAVFGWVAHGAYVALSHLGRRAWLRWLGGGAAIAVCFSPWAVTAFPAYAAGLSSRSAALPFSDYLAAMLGDAALGPSVPNSMAMIAAFIGLIAVSIGMAVLWRTARAWAGLLAVWTVLALVGIYAAIRVRTIYNTYHLSIAYPAIYVLFSAALASFWRSRRAVFAAACGLTLMGFIAGLLNYYFDPAWSKTRGIREAAAYLAQASRPSDVLITNFPDPATSYYLRRLSLPRDLLPPAPDFDPVEVDRAIQALAAQHDRMWHIPERAPQWDADGWVEARLADRYVAAADFRFHKVRLRQFVARPERLAEYQPLNVQLDDGVSLLGSYVTVNGDPDNRRPAPGDWLRVNLLWSASQRVPVDYTVFVHALDASNTIVGQHDGAPHGGALPTRDWEPGIVVLDVHEFQIPIDRLFDGLSIKVGLYDPVTSRRLALRGGGDSVTIWPVASR